MPWAAPSYMGSLPTAPDEATATAEEPGAPNDTTLPVGIGFTTGPSALMVGGTLDFPIDKKITFGPSLQYAFDDDVTVASVSGQLKYFMPVMGDNSTFLPYFTGGIGVTSLDKEGRSGDSGAAINIGAGVRYLTGEHYRLGTEARLYLLPDELGGEHAFFAVELLQIVISF